MRRSLLFALLAWACAAAEPTPWILARTAHFELYSQGSEQQARNVLEWFEQLRAFFIQQTGVDIDHPAPVRVVAFRNAAEYQRFRHPSTADAYYIGTPGRDYIVMASSGAEELRTAAHEYAHLILRAAGLHHPSWLNEGLAEFFSTIAIKDRGTVIGDDLVANSQTLRGRSWMPLAELLAITGETPFAEDRSGAELFYAESWLLAEMLVLSPNYGPRFHDVLAALTLGTPGSEVFAKVYGKSPDDLTRDLRIWAGDRRRFTPVKLPGVAPSDVPISVAAVAPVDARLMLADVALAAGDLNHAESLYRDLTGDLPASADIAAAFGIIAFRRGDRETARIHWGHAIALGIQDATLCYHYAILADEAGMPAAEIRPALERAVELKPDYDDARFKLALMEKNTGDYAAAAKNLQAMRSVAPNRAFMYWTALADSFNETDRRNEARTAAQRAATYAINPQQRAIASQLAYVAETDLTVAFATDANGRQQLVTTRVPHNTPNFNPFIEPGDDLRRVQGTLRAIDCSKKGTRFEVEVQGKRVILVISDPGRVQMRNAPPEFTCGPQPATPIAVEYAASKTPGSTDGVIRGLEFH